MGIRLWQQAILFAWLQGSDTFRPTLDNLSRPLSYFHQTNAIRAGLKFWAVKRSARYCGGAVWG